MLHKYKQNGYLQRGSHTYKITLTILRCGYLLCLIILLSKIHMSILVGICLAAVFLWWLWLGIYVSRDRKSYEDYHESKWPTKKNLNRWDAERRARQDNVNTHFDGDDDGSDASSD